MRSRAIAPTAAAVALLLGAACTGDGGDEATSGSQPDGEAGSITTEEPPSTTEATEADDTSEDTTTPTTSAAYEVPHDQTLDIELRNPNGVVLKVRRLYFEEGDIFVDAQVINGSSEEIIFHPGNSYSVALRLVDDSGGHYTFVEPEGSEDQEITVAPGESLDGTLAFRGPLRGEPAQIYLVTNGDDADILGFDVTDETLTSLYDPVFVVPFDLTWD